MIIKVLSMAVLLVSCSTRTQIKQAARPAPIAVKEFSAGEVILANQLLTKIFDQEMAAIACVPDIDEASLLLRTIRPRMEVVQDDIEVSLDQPKEVEELIKSCDKNCTCSFVDDLLREHLVIVSKKNRSVLDKKKAITETNKCLNYVQTTFCQSELFKQLTLEKPDFSFEEEAP